MELQGTRYSNDTFQLHALVNGNAMAAALTFRCLQMINHTLGITTTGPESGNPYNEIRFIGEAKPELTTAIAALKSLLSTISLLGTSCVTSDGGHPGVRAFMQAHNPCNTNARATGSGHQRVTVPLSQAVITGIGGQKGQTAYANLRILELSADGKASPHAIIYNAALPGSFIVDEEFVIGTPVLAGLELDPSSVLSWQLDPGVAIVGIIPTNGISPVTVDITKVPAKITITHDDGSLCDPSKVPEEGLQCAIADSYLPLVRRDPWGGLVDDAEELHIKIPFAGFATHTRRYGASGSATSTGEITIELTEGAGGVPLTVLSDVALGGSS